MLIVMLGLLALMVAINVAHAATAKVASVWTTDIYNNPTQDFQLGQTVRIHWSADGTVDIYAGKDGVQESWSPLIDEPNSGTYDFIPDLGTGVYWINVTGAPSYVIAYGTIYVVPDIPIGAITATVACFAAFGLFIAKKYGVLRI
jgi:hypothetical protein